MSAKIGNNSITWLENNDDETAADVSFLKQVLKRSPFLFLAKTTPETLPNYNFKTDFKYFYISDFITHFSCLHAKFMRRAQRASRTKCVSDVSGMMSSGAESLRNEITPTNSRHGSIRDSFGSFDAPPSPLATPSSPLAAPKSPVVVNATTLFPNTYKPTFQEDVDVTINYQYPKTLNVVEKFIRPGIDTIVHTTKTAAKVSRRLYILNVDAVYDDVEMGITNFKSTRLPAEMSDLERVPLRWFEGAFVNFPLPMVIVDKEGELVKLNDQMGKWEKWQSAVQACMDRVKEVRSIDKSKDCWELSRIHVTEEEGEFRVWIWKPTKANLYAACFRRHHDEMNFLPDTGTKIGESY